MKENGLTSEQVILNREKYGTNELTPEKKQTFFKKAISVLSEPMFILLILASAIYMVLGEFRDGIIMLVFVAGIISIEIIQEWKTDKTLASLKELSCTLVTCIRNGEQIEIHSEDIVPGDIILISEGAKIPADCTIISSNDLAVDESSLTGEAMAVYKSVQSNDEQPDTAFSSDYCYASTIVTGGSAVLKADKTGLNTQYGKIGVGVASVKDEKTPLQKQTGSLVKTCAILAFAMFIVVCIATFFNLADFEIKNRVVNSILSGITLSMAIIPEEFPVILTVFLSMGAWRLARKNSLIRKLPSVETLGSVSVLCVDKTGTITKNEMSVCSVYEFCDNCDNSNIMVATSLACEVDAYDPMEKAMISYANENNIDTSKLFENKFIKEYPFTNETKRMGHIWKIDDSYILCSKGSPEMILPLCNLSEAEYSRATETLLAMAEKGLRVIGVATAKYASESELKDDLADCSLSLCGFIGLNDPPRENVSENIALCYKAGVRVVMITGDNGITASAIAKQVGIKDCDNIITGAQIDKMSDEELCTAVLKTNIFSRVVPQHKMRIVGAYKANGETVAMTGDGVNDAPALKFADIGIAMGKRGSQVSREASDMILLDDNFSTIVETIKDGRRIYDNIRKAINYVLSIHIPIALSALLAPLIGIKPEFLLLLPLHVVILELVIDPTCSIVLERQPAESNIMERAPRNIKESILSKETLFKSIIQGFVIFIASFGTYLFAFNYDVNVARTMGICIMLVANLVLVYENSSNTDGIFTSFKKLIKDKLIIGINLCIIVGVGIILYTPLSSFLKLSALSIPQLLVTISIGVLSVVWYEIVKQIKNYVAIKKAK